MGTTPVMVSTLPPNSGRPRCQPQRVDVLLALTGVRYAPSVIAVIAVNVERGCVLAGATVISKLTKGEGMRKQEPWSGG